MSSFTLPFSMIRILFIGASVLGIGTQAHSAVVPDFHGKWRGECKTRDSEGREITNPSRLKIVQFGSVELKMNGTHYTTVEKNRVRSNLLGTGRIVIETSCQFLGPDQTHSLPAPFPAGSIGGFACTSESQLAIRGWNQNLTENSVLILVIGADGTLVRVQGSQNQPESSQLCHYRRD
jgi:hypothetical protein